MLLEHLEVDGESLLDDSVVIAGNFLEINAYGIGLSQFAQQLLDDLSVLLKLALLP